MPVPSGAGRECGQKIELGARQCDRGPAHPGLVGSEVDDQVPEDPWGLSNGDGARASQHGLDPCDEFAHAEGLGDVVIGAHLQSGQLVVLVPTGGEYEHIALGERPKGTAHLDPVQTWQPQIQDHHIRVLVSGCFKGRGAGVGLVHGVAGAGEIRRDHLR